MVDYLIAIVVAYIFFILIECPIYHLIKIICGKTVEDVIRSDVYRNEDNNREAVREYEENIEIKLFSNTATNEL